MSDVTALTVPPAGWYPDRNEANVVRWWDGQQWTDQTQSTTSAASAFEQPVSVEAFGLATPAQTAQAQTAPMNSTEIAPGWYPDNADPALQRWWDGRQWTAHTTPTVVMAPVASTNGPRPKNTWATLALLLSIVSFAGWIFAPVLLIAAWGIVMGIVALRRSRTYQPGTGRRGQAIAAIVVGAVSSVTTIVLILAAVGVYQHARPLVDGPPASVQAGPQSGTGSDSANVSFPSTLPELKQLVAQSVGKQASVTVTTVTCDGAASMVSGSIFQCGVIVADGRWGSVQVQILAPTSSGMSYGLGFGPLMSADATPEPLTYTVDSIRQELMVNLQQAWSSSVSNVVCLTSASMAQGSQFPCTVSLTDGRVGHLVITMVNPGGYDVTVVGPPASGSDSGGSDLSNS